VPKAYSPSYSLGWTFEELAGEREVFEIRGLPGIHLGHCGRVRPI